MSPEIPIIFQNTEIVVVDKPTGISIHNTEDSINLLEKIARQLNTDARSLHPVHRLDKETSGVQIFALDEKSAKLYAIEFQDRTVQKVYAGVLRGTVLADTGIWTQPLSDKAEGRINPAGLAKDRIPCETGFQLRARSQYFTMFDFKLLTGRQHQIRKHAALNGHALVGDLRYGDRKYNQRISALYGESRMFLHSLSLEVRGQSFSSPLPATFSRLFE